MLLKHNLLYPEYVFAQILELNLIKGEKALNIYPNIVHIFFKSNFIIYVKMRLLSFIHFLVVALVVAGGDVVHPVLVVEIPADGLLDAFLELEGGLPAELALELARVDGVAHVVTQAVGHIGDEVERLTFGVAEQAVDGLDDDLDEVDVLPLVEAADVVGLGYFAAVEDEVDGTGVVLDEEPVAHVLALAVDRQRLAVADVVDEQRYQLLGELVGAVVVRAVGHQSRHAVGVVICTHEVVA